MKNLLHRAVGFAVLFWLVGSGCDSQTNVPPQGAGTKSAYPLKTCVVSGKELGAMGAPFIYQHEGREVRFCCKECVKDFTADPAKFLAKLDEAGKK